MKKVTIQELKRHLSALLREAASGVPIVITRHSRPIALLRSAHLDHVHRGGRFGRGALCPVLHRGGGRRLHEVLVDDRRGRKRDR